MTRRWLTGWKSIAQYLDVSPRSAKRKAKRGMPVYLDGRTPTAKTWEIDEWREQKVIHSPPLNTQNPIYDSAPQGVTAVPNDTPPEKKLDTNSDLEKQLVQ